MQTFFKSFVLPVAFFFSLGLLFGSILKVDAQNLVYCQARIEAINQSESCRLRGGMPKRVQKDGCTVVECGWEK